MDANPRRFAALIHSLIGFVTNFFDTLGVGSFAPTTSLYKLLRLVPDERIPGTLNVGHALPTIAQALIFIAAVSVDPVTLVAMIGAAVLGAWLGPAWSRDCQRRAIQIGMGVALLCAAAICSCSASSNGFPRAARRWNCVDRGSPSPCGCNFVLGALMTLGVGLYAPCLILVSLLGMNPIAAFPIMMGSCAFLMPVAGLRFIAAQRYDARAALGLALGGIPGVLIAAFIVKQLPLLWLRWLVVRWCCTPPSRCCAPPDRAAETRQLFLFRARAPASLGCRAALCLPHGVPRTIRSQSPACGW